MSVGELLTAYAYEVGPKQSAPFVGGGVSPSTQLQTALNSTFEQSRIESAPTVSFNVDIASPSRSHGVRDAALAIAYGEANCADAAESLAKRLANVMDFRSKPSLLMISVHKSKNAAERRVLLWTFPQQEVFSLRTSSMGADLELTAAFVRESYLRKAALLQGPNNKVGMLSAQVLDFQSNVSDRSVADFWIRKFLEASLQMGTEEGTELIAKALRNAHKATRDNSEAQDQITAALIALRTMKGRRWSIDSVAHLFLDGEAAAALVGSVHGKERNVMFELDLLRFDKIIQYRRFTLDSGVIVSAPFVPEGTDSGITVTTADGQRRLSAEGTIQEELVRTRA